MGEGLSQRPVYRRHADLLATLQQAVDADPREAPFGVLVQDPWEDGDRQFFWYSSREQLEWALLDAHAFIDPEAFAEDHEAWQEPRFDLESTLQDFDELTAEEAPLIDEVTGEFFGVVWIGQFAQLADGDDDVAVTLRRELRRLHGGDGDPAAPLGSDAELDQLAELLTALG